MRSLVSFARHVAPLVLLAAVACYRTIPLDSEPPPPNQEVVLEFTESGSQRLGGLLGPRIAAARGRTVAWGSDTVTLAMIATTGARGEEQFWHGETVSIPRETVSRYRERRLDRARTALAIATAAVAAVAVQQVAGSNRGRLPPKGPGTPGTQ